jgi:4-diphosphocytidyl-2-C-methyl-D-erythritol kinase
MQSPKCITVYAPAKVNLYLRVTGRRPDGYHDLVSIMQALDLYDEVEVERTGQGISVTCDEPGVPDGPGNIAYRAAEALMDRCPKDAGVSVRIKKNIPSAAGLGGGSSDGAAVMRAMQLLFGLDIPREEMFKIAATVGADLPFFLGWPTALAEGIGDILSPLDPPPLTWVVLVNPGIEVPTGWVYANLNLGLTKSSINTKLPQPDGWAEDRSLIGPSLYNDLESVTVGRYPEIAKIKSELIDLGADGALMSGSGSTVFGLYGSEKAAMSAHDSIEAPGIRVIVTRTISRWPDARAAD